MNLHIIRAMRLINARQLGLPSADFLAALDDADLSRALAELLSRRGRAAARSAAVTVANGMSAAVAAGYILTPHAMTPYVTASSSAMASIAADGASVSAIAASSSAMTIIAASSIAMAAFAASSSAMGIIAASSIAMLAVLSSGISISAIKAVPAALAAITGSAALTKASVPKMTSNTSFSGVASASSWYFEEFSSWKAFDGTGVASYWSAADFAGASGEWIQYSFPGEAFIHSASIRTYPSPYNPTSVGIWHSDDGVVFTLAGECPVVAEPINTLRILTPGFHKHWRLVVKATDGAFPALHELNFTGFVKP